jgi:hypothetical protein
VIRLLPILLAALRQPGPLSPRIANYHIAVKLDVRAHSLTAKETLEWRNDGGAPTSELWFHLYWNAFKNETTAMMTPPEQGLEGRKAAPAKWGWIEVDRIVCAGAPQKLELKEDGTIARVALALPIAPGHTIKCDLDWRAQIPEIVARSGFAGDFFMIGQWFPKVGVWTGQKWKCHVYCASCEFFADFGQYDVEITVPEAFIVGASGMLIRSERRSGERTDVFHAEDVHDFAWAASPAFREKVQHLDARPGMPPVEARLLYQPQHESFADEHMRLLKATLRDYGDWFGEYPYTTLTLFAPISRNGYL